MSHRVGMACVHDHLTGGVVAAVAIGGERCPTAQHIAWIPLAILPAGSLYARGRWFRDDGSVYGHDSRGASAQAHDRRTCRSAHCTAAELDGGYREVKS